VAYLTVNGQSHHIPDGLGGTLLAWLRSDLGLTGAKPGCGEGACGACTVIMDGHPTMACRVDLATVGKASITTIEGLASDGLLHPAQQALLDEHAVQCGYCTPGMALRIAALLDRDPDPDREQIDSALGPSLCRCGCYPAILRAVRRAEAMGRSPRPQTGPEAVPSGPPPGAERVAVTRPWDLCPVEERNYFEVLGPGLMFVWPPSVAAAGLWATSGGAWMHLSPDGVATAFSGKVNVGQGNTAALRVLVAEELDAELSRVAVVQGDTDQCPFDMGTFGSRSLPDSGETLRRLAAGARRFLIGEAARRWDLVATRLDTESGRVVSRSDERQVAYGELASRGAQIVVVGEEPDLRPPGERRLVGRPGHGPRPVEAITGALTFGSDRQVPGMLYAAVLRPPWSGATLESLDTAPAEEMAGVLVVRAGEVVAVVADTIAKARVGAGSMRARWSQPHMPQIGIEEYLRSHPTPGEGWERAIDEATGDVEAVLAQSGSPFKATYTTEFVAHTPLETSSAWAVWEGHRVTCEVGTQTPFRARNRVAEACGVAEADVRILVPPTGGAYGGKHGGDIAAEAAVVARVTGRPIMVHWSRSEEFTAGYLRPMAVIDIRAALDLKHAIAAWDHQVINAGPAALAAPYRTAVRRLRSQPAESPARQGSYRALGATANNFARESAMDELALAAGADPLEFRLEQLEDERLAEVLRVAAARFRWSDGRPTSTDNEWGRGLAVGLEKGGRVATCAEITLGDTGRVRPVRLVTAYECGSIVDPDTVQSQVEGAIVMALGGALFEAVPVHDRRPMVTALSDYPVPRLADLPEIDVILVDRPDLPSAGAGETPMIAVAPAIANAIFNATGQRLRRLPLVP
jgi:CO/xanthine dehydrogenase Mo-binding subunit/aerobic-type carbon monoxide dehydrogenase small subunit (CoxS/CutS family)